MNQDCLSKVPHHSLQNKGKSQDDWEKGNQNATQHCAQS